MPADPAYKTLKKTYDLCTIYKIGKIGKMSDEGEISLVMIPASENPSIGEECYIIKDIYLFVPCNALILDWD